mgnify:CR=1 FL=1
MPGENNPYPNDAKVLELQQRHSHALFWIPGRVSDPEFSYPTYVQSYVRQNSREGAHEDSPHHDHLFHIISSGPLDICRIRGRQTAT